MRLVLLMVFALAWSTGPVAVAAQECDPAAADCYAPQPPAATATEAFLRLQDAVGALQDRAEFDPQIGSASVTAITAQINELQGLFMSPGGGEAQPAYVADLDATAAAILTAVETDDAKLANDALDLTQRDFQLKLASARATMGAEGGKPRTIPVTITTRRGVEAVSGLRVKLAKGLRPGATPTITFGQLSGPGTSGNVTPGVYMAYAYRIDAQLGDVVAGKEMLDIGLQGQSSAELDLRVN